jgi:hypothetical protein
LTQAFTASFQEVQWIVLAYLLAIGARSAKFGIMNENPAATDWTAERGQKWRAQLAGMEAMLTPVDEPLIRALSLDAPCRIADIGCGGGTTRDPAPGASGKCRSRLRSLFGLDRIGLQPQTIRRTRHRL